MSMNLPIVICDIDGVLADCTERLSHIQGNVKNWDAFFSGCSDDLPIATTVRFIRELSAYFEIVYITGRPERTRLDTVAWFEKHRVPFYATISTLLMRPDKDHREDFAVKRELFRTHVNQTRVIAVIEDRDQVVEMWRAEGLLCLQNKKGDY